VEESNGLKVGETYLFETANKFWLGRLVSVDGPYSVRIVDAAWIADTGRFHVFLRDGSAPQMEVEPIPDGVNQGLQWLHWWEWKHPLLREAV
jgi:hypothetical protein